MASVPISLRRGCRVVERGEFLLGGGEPGGIVGVAHHLHFDRHEGVAGAAQFGAFAIEGAGLGGLEPGVVEAAGHGVHLHAHLRHRPAMDHVGAGGIDLDHLVDRHVDDIVHAQQARLVRLGLASASDRPSDCRR